MTGLLIWFGLIAAAGLCFPRRPRVSGVLFIGVGVLAALLAMQAPRANRLAPTSGAFFVALGCSYVVKYRNATARAKHREEWTG